MNYFVYILFSQNLNRYYIGQTINLEERLYIKRDKLVHSHF